MMLRETPWDQRAFGFPTFELLELSEQALQSVARTTGHLSVKVDPLAPAQLLHQHGFYYCDTLLEPYCERSRFQGHEHPEVTIRRDLPLELFLEISHGAYQHGRFHRDFNLDRDRADLRYDYWTRDLYQEGNCLGLLFEGKVAGYIGHSESRLVLHAVTREFRGRGIAKYLWSAACRELFEAGFPELSSSVSASNLAVMNLYASLGFRFRNCCDVYHRFNPEVDP